MDVSVDQIRAWDERIGSGASVMVSRGDPDLSIVLTIIRRSRGLGVDHSDPDGLRARLLVDRALS